MAGVMAAAAASGRGMKVLLVEPLNVLGGQGTAGGVAGFCGDTRRVNYLFADLVKRLTAWQAIEPYNPLADRRGYELELFAYALQEMLEAAGVSILLHAGVVDARSENGWVSDVTVGTQFAVRRYTTPVVIDATGSCVVAAAAGFPVVHEGANRQLPMSLYFTLWDAGKPVPVFLPEGCPQWNCDDDLPMTTLHGFANGKIEVKMKVVGFDAADAGSLSDAERFARRQMMGLIYHLQTRGYMGRKYPTYALAGVSRHIGIREQRRIEGEHVLKESEMTRGCVFEDAVAVGTYHIDYHWPDCPQRAGTGITTMVEPYHIPLRGMIPRGARNLLTPGRSASGDQMAMSSFRVMATVAQMGTAAGVVAAHVVRSRRPVSEAIAPHTLRSELRAIGQSLDLSDYGQYLRSSIVTRELIFDPPQAFSQCHASTLVQLPNGAFLAAWFGGTQEKDSDTAIWCAERRQGGWSAPRRIMKVNDQAHWNPVLYLDLPSSADADSPRYLHLWFKTGTDVPTWRTWHAISKDMGATWQTAKPVDVAGDGIPLGPVKNKPIRLTDGTLLAGASDESGAGQTAWRAFTVRSSDGGNTWSDIAWVPPGATPDGSQPVGLIQPALWESQPGHVHMLLRSTVGLIYRSDSNDGGRAWSVPYPTDLPNNNSGLDVVLLEQDILALVCNPVKKNWGARTPLTLFLSHDHGRTWSRRLDIETAEGEYSYPAIIPTARGMAITYTWNRQRIAFWHGSIEQAPEQG